MSYEPQKLIAVDVDGTLMIDGDKHERLIEYCRARKADGFKLMLWSSRGEQHARDTAQRFDVIELFDVITSKPGYILDDKGWSWIKYTKCLNYDVLLGDV